MTSENSRVTAVQSSSQLSKEDWIWAALRKLASKGVADINVEVLARELGVTKGSFYWHFENKEALLKETLSFWQTKFTHEVAELAAATIETPEKRIRLLYKLTTEDRDEIPGGRVEFALREWSRRSEVARRAIAEVDIERTRVLANSYADMGVPRSRADRMAMLLMSHIIGINMMHSDLNDKAMKKQRDDSFELLMSYAKMERVKP